MKCPNCGHEWKREYKKKVPSDFLRENKKWRAKEEKIAEQWKIWDFITKECKGDIHLIQDKFPQKSQGFKKAYITWIQYGKKARIAFDVYMKKAEIFHIEQEKDYVFLKEGKISYEDYTKKYDLKNITDEPKKFLKEHVDLT